jgi:hypothetical protein
MSFISKGFLGPLVEQLFHCPRFRVEIFITDRQNDLIDFYRRCFAFAQISKRPTYDLTDESRQFLSNLDYIQDMFPNCFTAVQMRGMTILDLALSVKDWDTQKEVPLATGGKHELRGLILKSQLDQSYQSVLAANGNYHVLGEYPVTHATLDFLKKVKQIPILMFYTEKRPFFKQSAEMVHRFCCSDDICPAKTCQDLAQ